MLPVYICEDDTWQLKKLEKLIEEIVKSEKMTDDVEIVCATHDPLDVLKKIEEIKTPGIYFLDVQLGEGVMNGIDLGVKINKSDPKAYIVMQTIHADAALSVFENKIGAKDYILKDYTKNIPDRVRECIIDAYNMQKSNVVDFHDYIISEDEIYYIQSNLYHKGMLTICGKQKVVTTRGTIKEVEKKLGVSFFKCSRQCIINLKYVVGIDKKKYVAVIENKEEIPISIIKFEKLRRKYIDLK